MKLINKITHFVLFGCILFVPKITKTQTTFNYLITQPTTNFTDYMGIVQLADSTIYGAVNKHTSALVGSYQENYAIFSTDYRGNLLWLKDIKPNGIQGIGAVFASKAKELPDGNLAFTSASARNIGGQPTYGTGIIKITKQGDLIWSKYIEANNNLTNYVSEYVQLNPNTDGFTVGGTRARITNGQLKRFNFCVELDANGEKIPGPENERYFAPQNSAYLVAFGRRMGNNYFMSGQISTTAITVTKIPDNAPAPAWMKNYSPEGTTFCYFQESILLPNDDIVWAGGMYLNGGTDNAGLLVCTDNDGNLKWAKKYDSGDRVDSFFSGKITADGIVLASLQDIILKVDFSGNLLWANEFYKGQNFDAYFLALANAVDGGFISGGFSDVTPQLEYGLFFKTKSDGTIEECCTTPADVVVSDVNVTVQNRSFSPYADSVVVVPWPVTLTNNTWTSRSVCAPETYNIPNPAACTGGCITVLPPALPIGATASWEFPAGASAEFIPGTDSIRICFDNEGAQNLRLNIKLAGECVFPYDNTINITNTDFPLTFSLTDTLFCPGICTDIQLNSSSPATITTLGGTAQTGDSLRICYPEAGNYPITVQQMQEGCLRTHTIEVMVQNLLDETPNAFTPNGDGLNETFRPIIDCIPDVYLLQIFNRWGEMVFQTENYLDAWDGTYKGQPAPVDTYIWTVNSNNVQKAYKGDVTLIR
jgi:gliding motility-associated-like protein